MNAQKVDLLIQYALAVAAEEDSSWDRELRPIHLIKYCYLADLAYARTHEGHPFTGTHWRFHHYGPWSRDLFLRLEPAARSVGAHERRFSTERQENAVSWSLGPGTLPPKGLEPSMPGEVASAIKSAVHEFGSDTVSLLHYVYTTEPMLKAAPGEILDLSATGPSPGMAPSEPETEHRVPQLSKTALKKLRQGVKERLQAAKERSAGHQHAPAPPPYDEIFFQGQEWLDSLAGEQLLDEEGRVSFADSMWKSGGRREPRLP